MGIARGKTIEVKGSGEGTYTVLKVLNISYSLVIAKYLILIGVFSVDILIN